MEVDSWPESRFFAMIIGLHSESGAGNKVDITYGTAFELSNKESIDAAKSPLSGEFT